MSILQFLQNMKLNSISNSENEESIQKVIKTKPSKIQKVEKAEKTDKIEKSEKSPHLENLDAGKSGSTVSPMKKIMLDVFTDGSEIKEKKTYKTLGLGWAFVIKQDKITTHKETSTMMQGNNQRAELLAIYKALQALKTMVDGTQSITIYTDSDYAMKCITVWASSWKKNDWKRAGGKIVKHKDIIEPAVNLYHELQKLGTIRFQHVRSHTNKKDYLSVGNAEADELASSSSKKMLKFNVK